MTPGRKQVSRVLELAERIEGDIRRRNLKAGDRYYSTAEAAKMLRADTVVVNRALQLLAKRNVIERRQRSGAFIAAGRSAEDRPVLQQVHLLLGDAYPQAEGWLNHDAIMAIQGELPGVRIQLHSIPTATEEDYLRQMIRDALKSPSPEGFVLARTSLGTQRLMAASGLPVAVFGHPYPSVPNLPFVDRDQSEIGRLAAEFLLAGGFSRIAMFMRQRVLRGDHLMMEGARTAVGRRGIGVDHFSSHCLPQEEEEIAYAVRELLENNRQRTGIIVRSPTTAAAVIRAIGTAGRRLHEDVSVVVSDYFGPTAPPYPYIRTPPGVDGQSVRLARLIWRLACGQIIDGADELVPVQLEIPEGVPAHGSWGQANGAGGTMPGIPRLRSAIQ